MILVINNNQIDKVTLNNYESCRVSNIKLNYQQFEKIDECKEKTFNILVIDKHKDGQIKPILLSKCCRVAWGYVNKEGITNVQINYWVSELIDIDVYRDILINNLI